MSSSEKQKETPVQRPDDDKRTKSAKEAQNVTQTKVPYWWIMRRRQL